VAYLKAPIAMTLSVYTSRSFIDCNLFSNGMICSCKISLLTRASHGPSAIAELLVTMGGRGSSHRGDKTKKPNECRMAMPKAQS